LLAFFGSFSTYAQNSKLRVAVIDLSYPPEGNSFTHYEQSAMNYTSLLTTELVNTKKYVVMERSRVQQIIKELGLQSAQNASTRAAEIGNLLGVHKIITGEYLGNTKVSLRLIDVESGGIEAAVTMDNYIRDKKGEIKKSKGWLVTMSDEEFVNKLLAALLN